MNGSSLDRHANASRYVIRTVRDDPAWTRVVIGVLLLVALLHALWVARGLTSPAIMDTFRDAGFVQGIMDGNWFGDPSIAGAPRYYPPLLHALFAALAVAAQAPPLPLLVIAAPWVNLLMPLGFFLMSRSLFGAPAAVFATFLLLAFNGLVLEPWVSAAYHPWSSIPMLALAGFFFAVWLIHAKAQAERLTDAIWVGTAVGLTFLAHTVPALILAAMLPAAICASRGLNGKTLAWLALAGAVAFAWSLLLLFPLYATYRLHIVNGGPGAFTDPLFAAWPPGHGVLLALLPALALLVVALLGGFAAIGRSATALLAIWTIVPLLFLSRHYACLAGSRSGACTVFVLAVHHWFIYLQAAVTCIAGLAAWLCIERLACVWHSPRLAATVGWTAVALFAASAFWLRPSETMMRARSQQIGEHFDWQVYRWVTANTTANDMFVTELPHAFQNPASLAVMAAGRPSIALPQTYSNPYVDWDARNRRNRTYLAAVRGPSAAEPAPPCESLPKTAPGARLYIVLGSATATVDSTLLREFTGTENNIYRAAAGFCLKSSFEVD